MTENVTIPRAEYDRLRTVEEDFEDFRAAPAVEARIANREEELVPSRVADRLIDRQSLLRVWREHRGLSQSALTSLSGVDRVQIVEIKVGRHTGSVRTLRKLADALWVPAVNIITGLRLHGLSLRASHLYQFAGPRETQAP